MNLKHTLAATSAGLLLAASLATTTPAFAAGTTYDGTDPQTTGCAAGGITVKEVAVTANGETLGWAQLRYSPSCGTNWVRFTPSRSLNGWAWKSLQRPATTYNGVTLPAFSDLTIDSASGTSWGMQAYAPGHTCISYQVNFQTTNGSGQPGPIIGGMPMTTVC